MKIAIEENSITAIRWLHSHGYNFDEKFYNEFSETESTPVQYALTILSNLEMYGGKDYKLTEDDEEVKNMYEIINFLESEE